MIIINYLTIISMSVIVNCVSFSLRWGCKMSKLTWPMSKHSLNVPVSRANELEYLGWTAARHSLFLSNLPINKFFFACMGFQVVKARAWQSRNKTAIYRRLALLLANIETNGQYVSFVNEIFSTLPSARMRWYCQALPQL